MEQRLKDEQRVVQDEEKNNRREIERRAAERAREKEQAEKASKERIEEKKREKEIAKKDVRLEIIKGHIKSEESKVAEKYGNINALGFDDAALSSIEEVTGGKRT
jgi:hypothetical protein